MWQPIKTAPKDDMVNILATDGWTVEVMCWSDGKGCFVFDGWDDSTIPTLWQPLPEHPKETP